MTATALPIEQKDARLMRIIRPDSVLARLCTGAAWGEGPVWISECDCLLWSDIPNNRLLRWSQTDGMSVWRKEVDFTNGHARDLDGSLLHCSHGRRAITRTRANGAEEVVIDRYKGRRLNSPNDIVVKSDGTIWFSDPPYGILSDREGHKSESELGDNYVFRFDPRSGSLDIASDLAEEPNGLAFSPDESLLYVTDTSAALRNDGGGNHHIMVFDVDGTHLTNGRVFAVIEPGLADGIRVDEQGWVYSSSEDSIQVYLPSGENLGKLFVPEKVGNLTFGGPDRDWLYIVATTSLYRIQLNTRGA